MDKIDTNFSTLSHAVTINERKNLLISGVKKIDRKLIWVILILRVKN